MNSAQVEYRAYLRQQSAEHGDHVKKWPLRVQRYLAGLEAEIAGAMSTGVSV